MFHSTEWVYNCLLSLLDLSLFDPIGRHVSIACPNCHDDKHLSCGGTLSSPSNRVNSYDPDDGQLSLLKTPVKTVPAFLTPSSHCLLTCLTYLKGSICMTKYSVYSYPLLKNPTLQVCTVALRVLPPLLTDTTHTVCLLLPVYLSPVYVV